MIIDLALRSSLSAIEIDAHLTHGVFRNTNTRTLAQDLDAFSRGSSDILKSLMYAKVVWPNLEDLKGKTTEDLYLQMNLLAKDLNCFEDLSQGRQEELRDTCIRLSRLASAERNPYRMGLAA